MMDSSTVWYDDSEDIFEYEEIFEDDMMKINVSHWVEHKKRHVKGTLLLTPVQFIFEIVTSDPLDALEPDQFQLVLPTKTIESVSILTNELPNPQFSEYQSKGSKEASSKGIVITLRSIEMNEASKEIRSQTSSYGSSRLLPTYQFLLNPKRQQNFQKFMENCQINYEVIGGMIHKTNLEIKNSINEELPKSLILSHNQQRQLERHFPPRCTSHAWTLVFSTQSNGFSLSSLYRNCCIYEGPSLLVILSGQKDTFGAFLSEPPRISEKFFGTGESWLFSYKISGALDIHNWRGENNFIMKGNLTSLVIGSGENDNIHVILLHFPRNTSPTMTLLWLEMCTQGSADLKHSDVSKT